MSRRICLISEHASPLAAIGGVDSGGQNIYVGHVARSLARAGHKVDVFTRRENTGLNDVVEWKDGVRVVHVKAGPRRYVRKEELLPYMGEFTDYCLRFIKAGNNYDIIHANFWMSGLVAAELKQRLGLPFIVTFHALGRVRRLYQQEADDFPDERFLIEERIIAEADGIIAECPQDHEDLTSLYNADPAKVTIIPCGFDPEEFWPMNRLSARKELGLRADEFIVLQLGRIVPRKGIDTVIRGFARFLQGDGAPARLLVVGGESDGPQGSGQPEIERLREIAAGKGIEPYVSFLGKRGRDRLRYYYNASDVFVTMPWYEPFGITPVEAMACGVPVIGAEVGGIKYSVVDGETGFLAPPNDHERIAEILSTLRARPELREDLGQEGVKRANQHFTWQKVAVSIEALVDEVLAGGKKKPQTAGWQHRMIGDGFASVMEVLRKSQALLHSPIIAAADAIGACFQRGGKVLVCGNGGSAADTQHFVGELVGHFKSRTRPGLPALALTADSTILTACSNDMGYEQVFARQVEALGQPQDLLVLISTSGQSSNLIKACEQAHRIGISCLALLGSDGGELASMADIVILVPASDTQRVQEVQLLALHLISGLVEEQVVMGRSETFEDRDDVALTVGP